MKRWMIFVPVSFTHYMNENPICEHCKKPVNNHTNEELFSCKLEIEKKAEAVREEQGVIDDFNKIKSGEFYRMSGN